MSYNEELENHNSKLINIANTISDMQDVVTSLPEGVTPVYGSADENILFSTDEDVSGIHITDDYIYYAAGSNLYQYDKNTSTTTTLSTSMPSSSYNCFVGVCDGYAFYSYSQYQSASITAYNLTSGESSSVWYRNNYNITVKPLTLEGDCAYFWGIYNAGYSSYGRDVWCLNMKTRTMNQVTSYSGSGHSYTAKYIGKYYVSNSSDGKVHEWNEELLSQGTISDRTVYSYAGGNPGSARFLNVTKTKMFCWDKYSGVNGEGTGIFELNGTTPSTKLTSGTELNYTLGEDDSYMLGNNLVYYNNNIYRFNETTNNFDLYLSDVTQIAIYGVYKRGNTVFELVPTDNNIIGFTYRGIYYESSNDIGVASDKVLEGTQNVHDGHGHIVTGTMTNHGDLNIVPNIVGGSYNAGYVNSINIQAVDASIDPNITANNIANGVNILGVTGNLEPGGGGVNLSNMNWNQTIDFIQTSDGSNCSFGITPIPFNGQQYTGGSLLENKSYDYYYNNIAQSLRTITSFDTSNVTNMAEMFWGFSGLISVPNFDTSNATNMSRMLFNCQNLITIPNFDTSNATNISYMFYQCRNLTTIPNLDTSNATNMSGLFVDCKSLVSAPNFDTSNVTNMGNMFYNCYNLVSVPNFDASNVTYMSQMFYYCYNLASVPNFDTSNVVNMSYMFGYCNNIISIPEFNTSNATDMRCMVADCYNLVSVPNFDASNVTDMNYMFFKCNNLSNESVINIVNMCINAPNVQYKNLSNTNQYSPLYYTKFNNSYYTDYHQALTEAGWTF